MRIWRPPVIRQMEERQRENRYVGIAEDEIVHDLVETFHPSNIELRRVRFPLAEFIQSPENARLLLSEVMFREEKRLFNKTQRLNQEIAVVKVPWQTVDGKVGVAYLLHLVAGKNTNDALSRVRVVIEGNQEKEKRLMDKQRRGRYYREAARRTQESIEARRRAGRRRR